jgi:tape measure domain-containing protein
MPEIDPVILELRAQVDRYLGDVRRATKTVDQQLGLQEKRVRDLEAQMRKSSGAIGSSIKGLAATFATAFTGRELVGLIDGFTRLQNSLKVAGLEGANLEAVQSRLLELSGRYGVSIESLAELFGNASQAGRELGASQDQLLALTEATSQALLITGTSATQASGAILGLQQALASGTVRAEEFNQVNEGGLRPLLQAAAASERFGGSVAKLREAVLAGEVSSRDFFAAILAGSSQLEGQASKATLTIAGAFESLNSQLTVYVGQAAATNGASAAIAGGLQLLANNLDIVIPAIAVLASTIAVRFVAANVAAQAALGGTAASMGVVGAATFALQARLAGAATGMEAAAFAARGLQAALLGPVGIGLAVTAVALALGTLFTETSEATVAAKAHARAQEISAEATRPAAEAAERLANAHGKAREEALKLAQAERENTKKKLESARASLVLAQAELARAKAFSAAQNQASIGATTPGGGLFIQGTGDTRKATARQGVADAQARIAGLEKGLASIDAAIKGAAPSRVAAVAAPSSRRRSSSSSTSGGLSDADIRQAADKGRELGKSVTDSLRRLDQRTQDQFDLATAANQNEQDLVRASLALATTREDRARLENRLLDLQASQAQAEQELVLSLLSSTDVQERIAGARLAVLGALEKQARTESDLANQSPGQRFLRDLTISGNNINDQVEGIAIDGLQNLNDQLVDAILNAESLGDVFSSVAKSIVADLLRIAIQQAVIRPLAENLFGSGGGGSASSGLAGAASKVFSIGKTIGSLFARASGGPVAPGQVYRINEGASPGRVEGFVGPSTGGNIVPLGRMDAVRGGATAGGTVRIVIEEREGFASQVQTIAQGVSVEVVRATAPAIVDAGASEALRRSSRPRI